MKKLKLKPPINSGALSHLDNAVVYNERTQTIVEGSYNVDGAIRVSTVLNEHGGGGNYRFAAISDIEIDQQPEIS